MGVPNLLYAAYRYFTSSQRTVIWKDRPEADVDEPATSAGDSFAPPYRDTMLCVTRLCMRLIATKEPTARVS